MLRRKALVGTVQGHIRSRRDSTRLLGIAGSLFALLALPEWPAARCWRRMALGFCAVALSWALIGGGQARASLVEKRAFAVAATLPNGEVLIAGGLGGPGVEPKRLSSAELFNPETDTFSELTGAEQSLIEARDGAVAVRLSSGQILIAGGSNGSSPYILSSAELFNPATDTFTKLTGAGQSLTEAREFPVAATLPNGEVLIAGGSNGSLSSGALASAELFNPATDTFTKLTGAGQSLTEARYGAVAATLPSGQVLIAGGSNAKSTAPSAELFNPATDTFTRLGGHSPTEARARAIAATLANGQVLIAGGIDKSSAELFNPATDTFSALSEKLRGGSGGAAAALANGEVLIAGGYIWDAEDNGAISSAELFNPATDTFAKIGGVGALEEEQRALEEEQRQEEEAAAKKRREEEAAAMQPLEEVAAKKRLEEEAQRKKPKVKTTKTRKRTTSGESGISPKVRAELLKDARRTAAAHGDNHPYDIRAVLTTRVRAPGGGGGGDNPVCASSPTCATWPTYVVALRGDFQLPRDRLGRPGVQEEPTPPAKVMVFTLPAKKGPYPTGYADWFGLGGNYPNLKKMGVPVLLAVKSK